MVIICPTKITLQTVKKSEVLVIINCLSQVPNGEKPETPFGVLGNSIS